MVQFRILKYLVKTEAGTKNVNLNIHNTVYADENHAWLKAPVFSTKDENKPHKNNVFIFLTLEKGII